VQVVAHSTTGEIFLACRDAVRALNGTDLTLNVLKIIKISPTTGAILNSTSFRPDLSLTSNTTGNYTDYYFSRILLSENDGKIVLLNTMEQYQFRPTSPPAYNPDGSQVMTVDFMSYPAVFPVKVIVLNQSDLSLVSSGPANITNVWPSTGIAVGPTYNDILVQGATKINGRGESEWHYDTLDKLLVFGHSRIDLFNYDQLAMVLNWTRLDLDGGVLATEQRQLERKEKFMAMPMPVLKFDAGTLYFCGAAEQEGRRDRMVTAIYRMNTNETLMDPVYLSYKNTGICADVVVMNQTLYALLQKGAGQYALLITELK
jgi:hypothetical protein